MRSVEKLGCAVLLAVIFGGLTYGYDRERLRDTDLNPLFQQINREQFGGELAGVTIEWSHLDQKRGESRKLGDVEFLVLMDRNENTSIAEVRETLQHEACHVFVDWKEREEHGPMFQACMKKVRD